MPRLDMSDILTDADVADDCFTVTRNEQDVDDHGRGVLTPKVYPNVRGAVYPSKSRNVARGDSFEYVSGAITIVTCFRLTSTKTGLTADVVTWNGNQYTVTECDDYVHFGAGFVQAKAELLPPVPKS